MEITLWAVLFIILIAIELATLGLTTIWFAIGALTSIIAAMFGAGIGIQIGLFLAVSILTLLLTRPLAVRYFSKNAIKTNVEEYIGKTAIISKCSTEKDAMAKASFNGETWLACSEDGSLLEEDDKVEIVGINGIKLIVKKLV